MYSYSFRKSLEKELHKRAKKNPEQIRILGKKIQEIVSSKNINHYKNLRKPLQHLKRVHIDKSFVLVFSLHNKHIVFEDFNHHDKIYN